MRKTRTFHLGARAKGWALTTFLREAWGPTKDDLKKFIRLFGPYAKWFGLLSWSLRRGKNGHMFGR